jgi:lipid A oxidase
MATAFRTTTRAALAALIISTAAAAPAFAEMSFSAGIGANASPHSSVEYNFANGTSGDVSPGWDGASFEMPPVYNARFTYWLDDHGMVDWGVGVTYTHAKVKADLNDPTMGDFTTLEFTDGINFLTASVYRRFDLGNKFTPYVGVGAGLSIPKVEINGPSLTQETDEYQITGFAAEATAGVDYALTENWSLFGEYKFNYGEVDADVKGGGSLKTNIISNQVFFGVTYTIH